MSNLPHPEDSALARFADGELPPMEAREIERHLEACPSCHAEIEGLRATLAECLEYREALKTVLPAPPEAWADLRGEFGRIDQSFDRALDQPRERWWHLRPAWRWALAAAAVIAFAVVYEFRQTPSVQAATLLHRAEIAASKRPASVPRRVLVRTKSAKFTRVVGRHISLPEEPAAPGIEALFRAAHWNWDDPLSAQAFADWRDSVQQPSDTVTATADWYVIRTTEREGELSAASLTLRASDLEPLEARLEFRNQDWVDLSEATEPAPGVSSSAPPHAIEPPPHPAEPNPLATIATGGVSTSALLQVLGALHEMHADLGEQVEVNATDGRLVVSGVGIIPSRQQQIRAAVEKFPNVTVEFSEPEAPPANPQPETPPAATRPAESPAGGIAARVERQLGGHPQFERFSTQMLDWSDAAMAQVYALRRLAQRFPAPVEATFSATDRHTLRNIARQNAAELASTTAKMVRTLDPVLIALGSQPSTASLAPPSSWQATTEELLETAQRVERRLSVMLGVAPAEGAAFSTTDFSADLARLEADIANCQRLLAQE